MEDFATNTDLQNLVLAGLAAVIVVGGFLMMFTTVFTTKK